LALHIQQLESIKKNFLLVAIISEISGQLLKQMIVSRHRLCLSFAGIAVLTIEVPFGTEGALRFSRRNDTMPAAMARSARMEKAKWIRLGANTDVEGCLLMSGFFYEKLTFLCDRIEVPLPPHSF
jgi:hypothetical protein